LVETSFPPIGTYLLEGLTTRISHHKLTDLLADFTRDQ
jgi:hypothetical protein